ncbi:phage integrase central domain-containing protein [Desulfovibrio sp. SGI.169]|uniref:phage integrase central domain-containing protein n=1 Tax=Desulfovibrio sp. SGI.169 TaxID=3420561 RepID=UPI003D008ED5
MQDNGRTPTNGRSSVFWKKIFSPHRQAPYQCHHAERLLAARRVEERGALTIVHKALRDTGRIFRYAVVTGRAEHDIAADLRGALAPTANGHHAAITEPAAVGELLSYSGRGTPPPLGGGFSFLL